MMEKSVPSIFNLMFFVSTYFAAAVFLDSNLCTPTYAHQFTDTNLRIYQKIIRVLMTAIAYHWSCSRLGEIETIQWQSSQFRQDYQLHADFKAFYKIHRTPLTWFDARARCDREGAELVAPESHEEVELLRTLLEKLDLHEPSLYLGIHSLFAKGRFVTLSDVDVEDLNLRWESGEPNNYLNKEDCVTLNSNGRLSDTECNDVHPYVCKRKARNISWNNECNTYDEEYKLDHTISTCYKLHTQPKNWTSAYDVCKSEGGRLAIINSIEEKNFLVKLLGEHPAAKLQGNFNKDLAFIGFHDLFESREFRTLTGETLPDAGYDQFPANQPDNASPGEHCGALFRNGQLDDLWCERPFLFICERSNESREGPRDPLMKHFSKELVYIIPATATTYSDVNVS